MQKQIWCPTYTRMQPSTDNVPICIQNVSDTKSDTQPAHTATLDMMSYTGPDKAVKQNSC